MYSKSRIAIELRAAVLALIVLLVSAPTTSANTNAIERLEKLRAVALQDAEQESHWRDRHEDLLARRTAAAANVALAVDENSRARRLRRRRGGSSPATAARVREALVNLANVNTAIDEFYQEARSANVPPGWLRSNQ